MLLVGDDLVVIRHGGGFGTVYAEAAGIAADIAPGPQSQMVVVDRIDLSDPTDPDIVETLTTQGWFVNARLHDGTVRFEVWSDYL